MRSHMYGAHISRHLSLPLRIRCPNHRPSFNARISLQISFSIPHWILSLSLLHIQNPNQALRIAFFDETLGLYALFLPLSKRKEIDQSIQARLLTRGMAGIPSLSFVALAIAAFMTSFVLRAAQAQAPAPAPTSDGTSIDQGIAYILMLVALILTYLIHPLDASSSFRLF
ncbi:hypothetical protein KFK09_027834 [Dendrobium nobile]|uniref:Uncharacterized protein n=1 Tax=Dendrobium nobile TaxID=94219 RepID=A0A8T3A1M2_DENNO|nr:hypothetical protein KFK09_027834 [Dendrobium nobile]